MTRPSREGVGLVDALLCLRPVERREVMRGFDEFEMAEVLRASQRDLGTQWGLWADDPVGFISDVLGEDEWSLQRAIAQSVEDNERTVVPSSHASGKTHGSARIVAWWTEVHPPGTALTVTTAHRFRQVRTQLWPQIKRVHAVHSLSGQVDMTQWKVGDLIAAYGFASSDYDPDAVSGIHAPHLLIVVDEAGAISHSLGQAFEGLTTGGHTRVLVLGNPPVDEEGTWFETICESPLWHLIRIDADDTPNFTGEAVPDAVRENLIDAKWVEEQVSEYGPDSNWVAARVHARFPRGAQNKVVPAVWVEEARQNIDPLQGCWVRLGVDVAADGGDELAIGRTAGFVARIVHTSSGADNANVADVAGKVLVQILEAERLNAEASSDRPVHVKVDAIGVGWGVAGLLQRWGEEGRHESVIVSVNVGESASDPDRFANRRAEMWWTGRQLLQPSGGGARDGAADMALDVDDRTAGQLSGPKFGHSSSGKVQIEKKADMKKRGLPSPDRAEALLLSWYEPPQVHGDLSGVERMLRG